MDEFKQESNRKGGLVMLWKFEVWYITAQRPRWETWKISSRIQNQKSTAASHLSGLKILDGVLQTVIVHSAVLTTSDLQVSSVNSMCLTRSPECESTRTPRWIRISSWASPLNAECLAFYSTRILCVRRARASRSLAASDIPVSRHLWLTL